MPRRNVLAGRWVAGAGLGLCIWLTAQVGMALAAGPDTFALSQTVSQQLPTPTPFRFLTPTPFAPASTTSSSSSTSTTTAPRAGGFPMEVAFPLLAGGLAAIGGGALVFRRKSTH
jgi:hypothetical protein